MHTAHQRTPFLNNPAIAGLKVAKDKMLKAQGKN
jgi:hypothetical protein